jgi:hypothetical protein
MLRFSRAARIKRDDIVAEANAQNQGDLARRERDGWIRWLGQREGGHHGDAACLEQVALEECIPRLNLGRWDVCVAARVDVHRFIGAAKRVE